LCQKNRKRRKRIMAVFTKTEMYRINKENGRYDFDPKTRRWFNARIGDSLLPVPFGAVYVESTKREGADRRYTVRYFDERTGAVEKLSKFEQYSSKSGARHFARKEQTRIREEQKDA
jgi:hypothetical protein